MNYLLITVLLAGHYLLGNQASANMVVVVPKSSSINSLNNREVANIFLSRTNRFPNGEKSVPIELFKGKTRTDFYQLISGKSPNQLLAYWTTLVFTGKGKPPKPFKNHEQLIARLERTEGAITYIDAADLTDKIKVVYSFP